jgi:DNA-binding response OmpR family regulator
LVSDNPIAQNLLVKQLERHQLNVTATSNGEEALAGLWLFTEAFSITDASLIKNGRPMRRDISVSRYSTIVINHYFSTTSCS